VVHLPLWAAVVADVVAWAVIGVTVGYALHRTSLRRLDHDTWVTRARRWERGGRTYERLGIRRWKDRLPELGGLFAGGVSKRASGGRSRLERYEAETRRAEYVHWLVLACAPLFALWNPWYLTVAMVLYAVVANVPCLVVQRYNRARIARLPSRTRAAGDLVERRTAPAEGPAGPRARPTAT
jgi:glycosyl-4,4'-diaponeurosporenoate acyltransferase